MTRRDYWFGIAAIVVAILTHAWIGAMLPRYEWHAQPGSVLQVDRWKGKIRRLPAEAIGLHGVERLLKPPSIPRPDQRIEPPLNLAPVR